MKVSLWKKIRFKLEYISVYLLHLIIPFLGRKHAHKISVIIGKIAYLVDSRGRSVAIENVSISLKNHINTKDKNEVIKIVKGSYINFSQTIIDHFWSKNLNKENFNNFITYDIKDKKLFEEVKETGAIWVTPHYGNFEWLALCVGFLGYDLTIIAQDFKNEPLTKLYKKNRSISGNSIISKKGALIKLFKCLKQKKHAAFLTDLSVYPSKASSIIKCFNKKTCVTSIHAVLSKRTDLPIIPAICLPREDGNYHAIILEKLDINPNHTENQIAQMCWNIFEPFIIKNPIPWVWMYKHWKYLPTYTHNIKYPYYSLNNKEFNKLNENFT